MLNCGISSTWHIANSWRLIDAEVATDAKTDHSFVREHVNQKMGEATSVQATIENALRAAGLMG